MATETVNQTVGEVAHLARIEISSIMGMLECVGHICKAVRNEFPDGADMSLMEAIDACADKAYFDATYVHSLLERIQADERNVLASAKEEAPT